MEEWDDVETMWRGYSLDPTYGPSGTETSEEFPPPVVIPEYRPNMFMEDSWNWPEMTSEEWSELTKGPHAKYDAQLEKALDIFSPKVRGEVYEPIEGLDEAMIWEGITSDAINEPYAARDFIDMYGLDEFSEEFGIPILDKRNQQLMSDLPGEWMLGNYYPEDPTDMEEFKKASPDKSPYWKSIWSNPRRPLEQRHHDYAEYQGDVARYKAKLRDMKKKNDAPLKVKETDINYNPGTYRRASVK